VKNCEQKKSPATFVCLLRMLYRRCIIEYIQVSLLPVSMTTTQNAAPWSVPVPGLSGVIVCLDCAVPRDNRHRGKWHNSELQLLRKMASGTSNSFNVTWKTTRGVAWEGDWGGGAAAPRTSQSKRQQNEFLNEKKNWFYALKMIEVEPNKSKCNKFTSTQVFLGSPVPKSKCWDGSQDSKLPLHASHVALPT